MATRYEVQAAFASGLAASSSNLRSDGTSLWSYGWWEIARWVDGAIVLRKGESYSARTAMHLAGVVGQWAETKTPATQGEMNL